MAGASPVRNLCEETTCSICLEYFKDPVIIDCGHIFCQKCISQCWNGPVADPSCPQCRAPCQRKNIRPIRQLASIVEIAKKFSLHTVRGAEVSEEVCEHHQEPLKLFCENDQILICVVCDKSKEHRQHKVIPRKEAFEEYKNKIWHHLNILKKEREDISTYKQSVETEIRRLSENIETERIKIVAGFKQLREFLNKKEQDLLTQLQSLNKEIQNISNEKTARLSEKMSSMETDIKKMEEKHKQPENELLKDIKGSLKRCKKEKFEVPQSLFPRQRKRIEYFGKIHDKMQTDINNFKATIFSPIPGIPKAEQDSNIYKDPKIPTLVVECFPENCAQGSFRRMRAVDPTEDFTLSCLSYTMGFEKITSGCHSWEVEMENATFWAVGVAKESLRNSDDQSVQEEDLFQGVQGNQYYQSMKGGNWVQGVQGNQYYQSMKGGNWVQGVQGNQYYQNVKGGNRVQNVERDWCGQSVTEGNWAICFFSKDRVCKWTAFTSPKLSLGPCPFQNTQLQPVSYTDPVVGKKNIHVILDYEKGSVIFKDGSNTIYSFYNASFSGEPISSWVSVGK